MGATPKPYGILRTFDWGRKIRVIFLIFQNNAAFSPSPAAALSEAGLAQGVRNPAWQALRICKIFNGNPAV
jgi:hypothetical protein